jgi:hypothetical protein
LPALLHWGKSERGMMKDQPPFRLRKIQKLLSFNHGNNNKNSSNSMTLLQSLSLRRTHLKHLSPKLSMLQLQLGSEQHIRQSAQLFEGVVQNYLRREGVLDCFWTEEDQRKMFLREDGKMVPSPDFRVRDGCCVHLNFGCGSIHGSGGSGVGTKKNYDGNSNSNEHTNTILDAEQKMATPPPTAAAVAVATTKRIHWIEAKMFYGASTIPSNTPNAVGAILPKMNEYVSLYGTGAIVFMYGCGDRLAHQLLELGVVALDGRGLDVRIVEEYQRGWCADSRGNILF